MSERKEIRSQSGKLVGWITTEADGRVCAYGWDGRYYGYFHNDAAFDDKGQPIGNSPMQLAVNMGVAFLVAFPGEQL